MHGLTQDTSHLFAGLLQGQGGVPVTSAPSQLIDTTDENGLSPFLLSLQQSIQTLINNGQLANAEADPKAITDAIEQLLASQAANNGAHLPLVQGQDLAVKPEMLLSQFTAVDAEQLVSRPENLIPTQMNQTGLDNAIASIQQKADHIDPLLAQIKLAMTRGTQPQSTPLTPVTGLDTTTMMQHDAMDRRLMERLSATVLPQSDAVDEVKLAAKQNPQITLRQDLTATLQSQHGLSDADNQQPVETSSLLMRESAERMSANPSALLNPVLLERALMNMNKEQRTNPEMLNWNDSQLDPIASLQTGQMNRNVNLNGTVDARPTQSFIQVPLTDPQWQTDFSNRIVMLTKGAAQGQTQVAEIRLNPAHMGAIEVRVVMNDDQASITFVSQHGTVRDAIEGSLPRLREMFTSSGLMLSDAEVSDQSLYERRQQENQHAANEQHNYSESGFNSDEESEYLIKQIDLSSLSASSSLDLYA